MNSKIRWEISFSLITFILWVSSFAIAGNPGRAYYNMDNTNLFWFMIISDTHMGRPLTDADREHLTTLLIQDRMTINPKFIVHAGDSTDHLWCNPVSGGWPCDHLEQWSEYRKIVVKCAGMNIDIYSDAPGNHDQYWESEPLTFYLENSVQGKAIKQTQRSWVYTHLPSSRKYHFINAATPHPEYHNAVKDGLNGCPGQLDERELGFIREELEKYSDANLTFVFGHHPIVNLLADQAQFVDLLNHYKVSVYSYGHTHSYSSSSCTEGGTLLLNVSSLWEHDQYALVVVDNDGVSVTPAVRGEWPIVLITSPIDKNLGGSNPYAYPISSSAKNTIRALIFDENPVTAVQYRIDGGQWYQMTKIRSVGGPHSYLWETNEWDTTSLSPGNHSVEVQAVGSTARLNTILCEIIP